MVEVSQDARRYETFGDVIDIQIGQDDLSKFRQTGCLFVESPDGGWIVMCTMSVYIEARDYGDPNCLAQQVKETDGIHALCVCNPGNLKGDGATWVSAYAPDDSAIIAKADETAI